MVLLVSGLNKVRDLLAGELSTCDWGSGTTAETPNDVGLESEIPGVDTGVSVLTADRTINASSLLSSVSGNGSTVSEAVFKFSDGTVLNRNTFVGISKSDSKEIHVVQIITVEGV